MVTPERTTVAAVGSTSAGRVRPTYRKVLVAVDDSPAAGWAQGVAADLAKELGASVALVHVTGTSFRFPADWNYVEDELRARKRMEGEDLLGRAVALMPPTGGRVEAILREGGAGREIVRAARDWGADLVVMGSRGRGRVGTLVQGSTTQEVIHDAPCPVVVVSHERAPSPGAPPPATPE